MEHEIIKLTEKIGTLIGEVRGINKRLDTLNGSGKDRDDKIDILEDKVSTIGGKIAIIVILATGFSAAIFGAIMRFIK